MTQVNLLLRTELIVQYKVWCVILLVESEVGVVCNPIG